jgi:hypothetical protein
MDEKKDESAGTTVYYDSSVTKISQDHYFVLGQNRIWLKYMQLLPNKLEDEGTLFINKRFFFILPFLSPSAWAQITDASFFPSVKSLNPGVVHMRRGGLISLNYGKQISNKKHYATSGGVIEPLKTDISLTKNTLFLAGASRLVSAELLLDKETGTKAQRINHPTRGNRKTLNDAESTYFGGILDFRFFGVSYANARYRYLDEFRAGTPPDLSANDQDKQLTFTNLKIGSAIKIGVLRLGAYFLTQKGTGSYTFTFYDPTTGNKGSTEEFPVDQSAKGYGVGLGCTLPKLRSELSYEKLGNNKFNISDDYFVEVPEPSDASRITIVAETKLSYFSAGIRFRSIKGNYIDLEDIISSNILYDTIGANDTRNEMTFNFSLGDSRGFSPAIFYTQSKITSQEKSPVFDNGLKYKAVTQAKAYGASLTYRF